MSTLFHVYNFNHKKEGLQASKNCIEVYPKPLINPDIEIHKIGRKKWVAAL